MSDERTTILGVPHPHEADELRGEARKLRRIADRLDERANHVRAAVRPGDFVRCIRGGMFSGLMRGRVYRVEADAWGNAVVRTANNYYTSANDPEAFERIDQELASR